jgi:tetratricopeptide (TPR) repeat protein
MCTRTSGGPRVTGARASALALLLASLAACASARAPAAAVAPPAPAEDLVAIARALGALDAAERRGTPDGAQARSEAARSAGAAEFLALCAAPRDERTWSAFRALLDAAPKSPWPHLGMARIYLEWRTWDQLELEIGRALAKAPGNWIAVLLRAQAQERRERDDAARVDYQAVLRADPDDPEAHAGLARLARRARDAEGARREAEAAVRVAPDHHPALVLLGALAAERGDRTAAVGYYERAAQASPHDRDARIALARLYRELGEKDLASEQWRQAVGLREDAASLREMAELTRQGGDAAGERRALERLVQVDPTPAVGWRRLAELRLAEGDEAGAEQALKKTLERDPSDGASHVALARVLLARADATSAVRELRVAGAPGASEREALERRLHVERVERKDLDGLQRAVGALIDRTYRARLEGTPRLSGLIRLRATVDGEGTATQIEVLEDTIHDELVRACAYWNLKDATYPKGKPARYGFTFSFRPPRG